MEKGKTKYKRLSAKEQVRLIEERRKLQIVSRSLAYKTIVYTLKFS